MTTKMVDSNARYLDTHEWAKQQGDDIFTIGLSGYAIEQLGEIVFIDMPTIGEQIQKDETFGILESFKATADLAAPLSGTVIAVNTAISDNPAILHKDAYDAGWLIKIQASEASQFETLMDADAYRTHLQSQ